MPIMRSWVDSANDSSQPFPLNNLPYGVFSTATLDPRPGAAIGDMIFDLQRAEELGLVDTTEGRVFDVPFWNEFFELGSEAWQRLRNQLTGILAEGSAAELQAKPLLVRQADAEMHMPFIVSEYTDFYAGKHHAMNIGTMLRGAENALPPNWLHIPIGYNGRASSVVVSGTDVRRPWGQVKGPQDEMPRFAPSARFDIELEMGAIVGQPTDGPITVQEADDAIFGYVLLNDWSARDIQGWEYQPLGPFQAKATATTISPWIITKAALEPFRCNTPPREVPLLPYLEEPGPMLYNIPLEVTLKPEGGEEVTIARTNYNVMYYSAAQQMAHHTTSGCGMAAGDLLGSGTISGPEKAERGSMFELSWGTKEPIDIGNGQTRGFIEDGDTLTLKGGCQGDGFTIGFGECTGKVLPALKNPYAR